jgi:hypothetical protein
MTDQPHKAGSLELGRITFCYPAPRGLPVPVKPKRGRTELLEQMESFDWSSVTAGRNDDLIRAGAFWLHGFLEESHRIAQGIHKAEGSYWHGLMHRSEGDFSNAMYWFRRVGSHAIFPQLLNSVQSLQANSPTQQKALNEIGAASEWQPQWLVDLCGEAYWGHCDGLDLLQRIATLEYDLLMGYCLRM